MFFFNDPAPSEIYTLSLHDALPICLDRGSAGVVAGGVVAEDRHVADVASGRHARGNRRRSAHFGTTRQPGQMGHARSEEHTSELQSRFDLVCRLLLEKKKTNTNRSR